MTDAEKALLRVRGTPLGCTCPERNIDPLLDALDAAERERDAARAALSALWDAEDPGDVDGDMVRRALGEP